MSLEELRSNQLFLYTSLFIDQRPVRNDGCRREWLNLPDYNAYPVGFMSFSFISGVRSIGKSHFGDKV